MSFHSALFSRVVVSALSKLLPETDDSVGNRTVRRATESQSLLRSLHYAEFVDSTLVTHPWLVAPRQGENHEESDCPLVQIEEIPLHYCQRRAGKYSALKVFYPSISHKTKYDSLLSVGI